MRPPTTDERDALRDLSVRYASAVDRRDRDRLLGAFHPDAELVVRRDADAEPTPMHGHDQIGRIVERIARYRTTFHLLGQSTYEIGADGRTATGEVYCTAHHLSDPTSGHDDGTDQVLLVRYLDEYRADDHGAWTIRHRTVRVDASVVHPLAGPTAATTATATATDTTEEPR